MALPILPAGVTPPVIGTRHAPLIRSDGHDFRDLNRNGQLDPYKDWRLPVRVRCDDLIARMTVEEKVGILFHPSIHRYTDVNGELLEAPILGRAPRPPKIPGLEHLNPPENIGPKELITARHIRWMLVRPNIFESPNITAHFANRVQEVAEGTRHGIPAVFSSDPRHAQFNPPGLPSEPRRVNISRWPDPLGLAAIGEYETVQKFAKAVAREYRALGIHVALAPSADIASEPRWNRIHMTFGEDVETVCKLTEAFITGLQGTRIGSASVLAVTKHFPGNGPMLDGWDSHNHYGKLQIYPGGRFELHQEPFKRAIRAGTGAIMPGYGIASGVDTVGMCFSKKIVTNLLREQLGFSGMILSDWLHFMPWGLEDATPSVLLTEMLSAGIDQFGGNNEPDILCKLVRNGLVEESRIDESVRRVLDIMFRLGIFENPYVDEEAAALIVGDDETCRDGQLAQAQSVVVLKNALNILPLQKSVNVHLMNMDTTLGLSHARVVDSLEASDAVIVSIDAPYLTRKDGTSYFPFTKEGTLSYEGADNEHQLRLVKEAIRSGKSTIVLVHLDRPAILSGFIEDVDAVLGHFNVSQSILLDVVFGTVTPRGKLPFDLPRTNESVQHQLSDVPGDLADPLFRIGHSLPLEAK